MTLKNVLEKLSNKNKIILRNLDLYYFIEHIDNEKEDIDDMDNAINMETQLKFLNNYELDVFFYYQNIFSYFLKNSLMLRNVDQFPLIFHSL